MSQHAWNDGVTWRKWQKCSLVRDAGVNRCTLYIQQSQSQQSFDVFVMSNQQVKNNSSFSVKKRERLGVWAELKRSQEPAGCGSCSLCFHYQTDCWRPFWHSVQGTTELKSLNPSRPEGNIFLFYFFLWTLKKKRFFAHFRSFLSAVLPSHIFFSVLYTTV